MQRVAEEWEWKYGKNVIYRWKSDNVQDFVNFFLFFVIC